MSAPTISGELAPLPLDDAMNMLVQEFTAWLYNANPFWAAMLSSPNLRLGYVPPALQGIIDTAATDGYTTVWLNRKFFESEVFPRCAATGVQRVSAVGYVLLHEIAHILADHSSEHHRSNMTDKKTTEMAVDYQVFDMLAKDGFMSPNMFDACPIDMVYTNRQVRPNTIPFYGDANMRKHVPDGDDVLKIYEYLLKQQSGGKGKGKGKGKPNPGAMSGDVQPENSPGVGGEGDGDGDGDGQAAGNVLPSASPNAVPSAPPQNMRDEMIANAVIAAKTIGNMSHTANRFADALTKSKTPWQRQLANLMSASCARAQDRKRSYRRIGRRTDPSTPDYAVKPGRIRDPKPGILLVADSSGSISDKELQKFAAECEGILASGKVGYISVIYCDTVVCDKGEKFTPRQKVRLVPGSSGGTDFEPVWHHQRKHYPEVAAIVYLTDLYGSFGDKKSWPKVPVIWGATTELHPPFGKPVRIGAA